MTVTADSQKSIYAHHYFKIAIVIRPASKASYLMSSRNTYITVS